MSHWKRDDLLGEVEVDCGQCRGRGEDRRGDVCLACDGFGTVLV